MESGESLPKHSIIRHKSDFDRLFGNGRIRQGTYIYAHFTTLTDASSPALFKIGLVCGKRIGVAAVRNRYKRRMREIVRRNKTACAGFEVMIVAKPAILQSTYEDLRLDILDVLQRIRGKGKT